MCVSTKYYEEIAPRQVRVNIDWLRIVDLALAEFDKPMSPGVTRQRGAWWLLSRSLRPTGSEWAHQIAVFIIFHHWAV